MTLSKHSTFPLLIMVLRIAILGCDFWSSSAAEKLGDVSEQFNKFFLLSKKPFTSKIFNIHKKEFPNSVDDFDLFIVTGSKYSTYDSEEWLPFLFDRIQYLDSQEKRIFGVCFGHQVRSNQTTNERQAIAHALGGKVEKVVWNFGHGILTVKPQFSEQYRLPKQLAFLSIHQDQVVKVRSLKKSYE